MGEILTRSRLEFPPLIVLAGGASRRMGVPKGLMGSKTAPWLETQLAHFVRVGGTCAVVVLGYHRNRYVEAMPWLQPDITPPGDLSSLEVITSINPRPEDGPFSSLRSGLAAVQGRGANRVWVLPVDVPCPDSETFSALLAAADDRRVLACVPVHAGCGGHPVLLDRRVFTRFEHLAADDPEARLDKQIRKLEVSSIRRVDVDDPAVCLDLNTPEDLADFHRTS